MYAIIDKRAPLAVKRSLKNYTKGLFEFSSEGITYNSISGHPDIFMFQNEDELILAPNSPKELLDFLKEKHIGFSNGKKAVGESLDDSVLYNCISSARYFFCKAHKPDITIQKRCAKKRLINLPQAYARCSMFAIDDKFITSDKGIAKVLEKENLDHFYFNPSEITIEDHKNGFIGGTMGAVGNKVFFLGNILKHKDGKALHAYITAIGKEVICLGNEYLYDGGGLFFVS